MTIANVAFVDRDGRTRFEWLDLSRGVPDCAWRAEIPMIPVNARPMDAVPVIRKVAYYRDSEERTPCYRECNP